VGQYPFRNASQGPAMALPGAFGGGGYPGPFDRDPNYVLAPDQVAQFAESLNCPLVVDEAYADFAEQNCLELVQQNPRVFVTRTLSKSYGLAGVRFGFLVANPDVIQELAKIKDSYNCDGLSIAAATAAMGCREWLADVCAKLTNTRQRMSQRLVELGFQVTPSQANFVWCQHPSGDHNGMYEFLKKYQILVRYMEFGNWGDGLRISVGTDEQVDACMMLLQRYLDDASNAR
jgi:histidinol-phosphate aminotransferase